MQISWITNQPAPYRYPIWVELGKFSNLKVYFTNNLANNQGWKISKKDNFDQKYVSVRHFFQEELEIPNWHLLEILKSADVVVSTAWQSPFSQVGIMSAKVSKKKTIFIYESTSETHRFDNFLVRNLRRFILGLADFIVTVGESSTNEVISIGIPRYKIVELFNPVDVELYHSASLVNRATKSNLGHRFIFVGQLIPRKNVGYLLEAFTMIANPSDSLDIAGDGELRQQLEEYSRTLGISDQVRFIGFVDPEKLPFIYSAIDTLVLPSSQEVWGLVVNEALASGAHVVVARNAGVSASIKGMNGVYLCEPDTESIASAMEESRRNHKGPINSPEILEFTPEKFAQSLLSKILLVEKS